MNREIARALAQPWDPNWLGVVDPDDNTSLRFAMRSLGYHTIVGYEDLGDPDYVETQVLFRLADRQWDYVGRLLIEEDFPSFIKWLNALPGTTGYGCVVSLNPLLTLTDNPDDPWDPGVTLRYEICPPGTPDDVREKGIDLHLRLDPASRDRAVADLRADQRRYPRRFWL